jgi:hypothetical protein
VVGCHVGLFGIAFWLTPFPWLCLALPVAYCAFLTLNLPRRVLLACVVFVALFFGFLLALPPLPIWLCIVLVVLSHRIQNWSHKLWNKERDMMEFDRKYQKGPALFVLLSLYELPILLNYLLFGRKDWAT